MRLTEVYYECKKSPISAFFSSVGISSGTALSVKVAVVVGLALLLTGKQSRDEKTGSYRTYGIDERDEVRE